MAERIRILIDARDRASRVLRDVEARTQSLSRASTQFAQRHRQSLALAAGALAGFVGVSIKAASDLAESQNAVNVAFGEGAERIHAFGETSSQSVGLATAAFNQLATTTGSILQNAGLDANAAAAATIDLTQRAADLASVYNTDVSLAFSALNQAIRGETEAIRAFGGDVTDATLQAYALAQGLNVQVASLSQAEKAQLRLLVVMDQTSRVSGDFENTQRSLANTMRRIVARAQDTAASLGGALLPAAEALAGGLEALVRGFEGIPEPVQTVVAVVSVAGAGLAAALAAVGFAIGPVTAGFKALQAAAVIARARMLALNLSLLANPFVVVGAAVAALVVGLKSFLDRAAEVEASTRELNELTHGLNVAWDEGTEAIRRHIAALDDVSLARQAEAIQDHIDLLREDAGVRGEVDLTVANLIRHVQGENDARAAQVDTLREQLQLLLAERDRRDAVTRATEAQAGAAVTLAGAAGRAAAAQRDADGELAVALTRTEDMRIAQAAGAQEAARYQAAIEGNGAALRQAEDALEANGASQRRLTDAYREAADAQAAVTANQAAVVSYLRDVTGHSDAAAAALLRGADGARVMRQAVDALNRQTFADLGFEARQADPEALLGVNQSQAELEATIAAADAAAARAARPRAAGGGGRAAAAQFRASIAAANQLAEAQRQVGAAQAAVNLARQDELLLDSQLADLAGHYGSEWTASLREVQAAQIRVREALADQADAALSVEFARRAVLDIEQQIAERITGGQSQNPGIAAAREELALQRLHFADQRRQLAERFDAGELTREQFDDQAQGLRQQLDDETLHLQAKLDQQRLFGEVVRLQNADRLTDAQQELKDAQDHQKIVNARVEHEQKVLKATREVVESISAHYQAQLQLAQLRIDAERIAFEGAADAASQLLLNADSRFRAEQEITNELRRQEALQRSIAEGKAVSANFSTVVGLAERGVTLAPVEPPAPVLPPPIDPARFAAGQQPAALPPPAQIEPIRFQPAPAASRPLPAAAPRAPVTIQLVVDGRVLAEAAYDDLVELNGINGGRL